MADLFINSYDMRYLVNGDYNAPNAGLHGEERVVPLYGASAMPSAKIPYPLVGSGVLQFFKEQLGVPTSTIDTDTFLCKVVVVNNDAAAWVKITPSYNMSSSYPGGDAWVAPGGKFESVLPLSSALGSGAPLLELRALGNTEPVSVSVLLVA